MHSILSPLILANYPCSICQQFFRIYDVMTSGYRLIKQMVWYGFIRMDLAYVIDDCHEALAFKRIV